MLEEIKAVVSKYTDSPLEWQGVMNEGEGEQWLTFELEGKEHSLVLGRSEL